MNLTILAIIISSAAFITSLFAANWLNQRYVEKLMDQFGQTFGAKLETISVQIKSLEEKMDVRFEAVDRRFDQVDRRLDQLGQRMSQVERVLFQSVIPGAR